MSVNLKKPDVAIIVKRLVLIKGLISLEEENEIINQLNKLLEFELDKEAEQIVSLIRKQSYSRAITLIEEYINDHNQLTKFIDPEIEALRFEVKTLESLIQELSNEKSELDKLIHTFSVRHNKELGEIINEILLYRMEKLEGTQDYFEAEKDYNDFFKDFEASKNENIPELSLKDQRKIKEIYRKATKLCHPDIVNKLQQSEAHKIFIELKAAYESNNLDRVIEIYNELLYENFFISKSDSIDEKSLLQQELKRMRTLINDLKDEIDSIKDTEIYHFIAGIEDWDKYFFDTKILLEAQLHELKNE